MQLTAAEVPNCAAEGSHRGIFMAKASQIFLWRAALQKDLYTNLLILKQKRHQGEPQSETSQSEEMTTWDVPSSIYIYMYYILLWVCFRLAFRSFQSTFLGTYFIEENEMNENLWKNTIWWPSMFQRTRKTIDCLQYLFLWPALFKSICGHWPFVGCPKYCTSFLLPPSMPV